MRKIKMDIKKEYERWLANAMADADVAAELKTLDDAKIEDAFYRDLDFGTGGLRGVIGAGTNRMNLYTVRKATQGLADYLNATDLPKKIAIAHDSRNNGGLFTREAARVLAANGITACVYPRLEPTPALSWAVRYLGCGAGVCITASHNPAKYNGYKVYGADGCQITLEVADKILAAIEKVDCFDGVKLVDYEAGVQAGRIVSIDDKCLDVAYENAALNGMSDRGEMTGEWLANCQACSLPEFCSVFNRAGTKYDVVTGYLDDAQAWAEIYGWIDAAKVACGMRRNRMGLLGNYYGGMVDVYSDLRLQSTVFGTHAEILEMCELHELRRSVTQREADARVAAFGEAFVIDEGCTREELERAARTSVALDKLAEAHRLGSLAYYYAGAAGNAYEDIVTSVIAGNTLLTGRGIPVAGEYEVKNVQAMKIMSLLGAGGCFSEFYGMDFTDDVILLGHDGPAHFLLGEEKARLVPLPVYHGKPGKGLSIQMSVKHGPVTLLSVVEGRDGISFLLAEGESVPGPVLNIGNINSRYRFPLPAREFIDRWSKAGPSHHCAIGVGHVAGAIRKYAALLGIPVTVVC